MPTAKPDTTIEVAEVQVDSMTLAIRGTTPLICNRMSEKAKRELLLPLGRKTVAQRAASLKHNPIEEYRASPYTLSEDAPTRLALLSTMFKGAIATAALDLPGARKAQIERLVHPVGNRIPLYGVPQLYMSTVRSADMNRTPDIRTRAIVPEWCCFVTMQWVKPIIHERTVINLLAAAGFSIGVGDWRPEKGSGTFGQFIITNPDDADVQRIMATGGRSAQDAALAEPTFFDEETAELYAWYETEIRERYAATDVRRMAVVASGGPDDDESEDDLLAGIAGNGALS